MRIEIADLINLYYRSIQKDYPDLSFDQIKECIMGPWSYTKFIFESGSLDKIRLKYFGVFQVPPTRAKRLLEEARIRFSKNYITPKQYFKIKSNIETYLKSFENEDTETDAE